MTQAPATDEQVIKDAERIILGGRCVAFLGAGVSIPPGEQWKMLVEEIAERCDVPTEGIPLPIVIDQCINKDLTSCNDILREKLHRYSSGIRPVVSSLMRLPFRAILTTNFDPWVHSESVAKWQRSVFVYPDLPLGEGLNRGLYYLHGYYDSDSKNSCIRRLVFGEESFERAYHGSLLEGFLLQVLTYESILFVGFDPTEERFATILGKAARIRRHIMDDRGPVGPPRRFALWALPYAQNDVERAEQASNISHLRSLDLEVVLYDREGETWRGLDRLVDRWVEEGDPQCKRAPFRSGFEPGSDE